MLLTGEFGLKVEVGEIFEETEYLWLGEDIWENSEVYAEFTEAGKVHLTLFVSIEGVEWQQSCMHDAENLNNLLIS